MSMLELKGQKIKLERDIYAIDVKSDAVVKGIRHLLTQACITVPIEEVDVEGAASLVAELIELKGEKIRNMGMIKRIEKELA